jgi:hypothetical protein
MDNNEIFLDFWKNYQWIEPQPVLFRLYHSDQGAPLEYSHEDRPGLYIDVTPEQFVLADFRVRVIQGQIVPQDPPLPPKLMRSEHGTRCHPRDITVIVDQEPSQAWSMKTHEN